MVLHLSGALVVHPKYLVVSTIVDALVIHGFVFRFIYDENQQMNLRSFILSFLHLKLKPCCWISCRTLNVPTITQWTIEHTTPLPSVVFRIFSMVG